MTSLHPLQEEDNLIDPPSNQITENIQLSKRRQNTLNLMPSKLQKMFTRDFFVVDYEPTLIRTINPYYVVDAIEELTGESPVSCQQR